MRITSTVFLLATAVSLAGCASRTAKTDAQAFAYAGPPVTLRPAPGASGEGASKPATRALDYVNARREEAGLPVIAADPGLEAAASAHARYVALNRAGTHDEIEGRPGFTGVDVLTRVRLHTHAQSASEVVGMIGSSYSAESPIEHIFASPYHRGALLFDWARGGEGSMAAGGAVTVVDFADIARSLADNELVAWPYDGQSRVPVAWVNNEQPDPMGQESRYRGQVLGYPITLSGGPNAHIELKSFELRDARGSRIPCRIAPLTAADDKRNTAICTPFEPLKMDERYSVRAQGTLRQIAFTARFDLNWRFTTIGAAKHPGAVVAESEK